MWDEDHYMLKAVREMEVDFMVIDTEGIVVLAKREWDGKIILDDCIWGPMKVVKDVFYSPLYPNVLVQVVDHEDERKVVLHDEKGRVYDIRGFMRRPEKKATKKSSKKDKKKKKKSRKR